MMTTQLLVPFPVAASEGDEVRGLSSFRVDVIRPLDAPSWENALGASRLRLSRLVVHLAQAIELGEPEGEDLRSYQRRLSGEPWVTGWDLCFDRSDDPLVSDFFAANRDMPADPMHVAALEQLGYRLKRVIGAGRFGAVYASQRGVWGQRLAVKLLPSTVLVEDLGRRDLLLSQLDAASRLKHDYIERVELKTETFPLLVGPVVKGKTFDQWIGSRGSSLDQAVRLIGRVAEALEYAHWAKVAHGDVRPCNIVVKRDSRPCLVDFGLAGACLAVQVPDIPSEYASLGISPGQFFERFCFESGRYDDILGVGLLLGAILIPFFSSRDQPPPTSVVELRARLDALPARLRGLDSLRSICLKALDENPLRRFSDMSEFRSRLEQEATPQPWGTMVRGRILGHPVSQYWGRHSLLKDPGEPAGKEPSMATPPIPSTQVRKRNDDEHPPDPDRGNPSINGETLLKEFRNAAELHQWHEMLRTLGDLILVLRVSRDDDRELHQAVADELVALIQRHDLNEKDRSQLILATEFVQFPTSPARDQMIILLLNEARNLEGTTDGRGQQVLWAAIRRYASMIPESEAGNLLEFLQPGTDPDTRLVALRAIRTVFSAGPPRPDIRSDLSALTKHVAELSGRILGGKKMKPGWESAMAVDACLALTVLGAEPEARHAIEQLLAAGRPALVRILREDLLQTRDSWFLDRPHAVEVPKDHPAVRFLEALAEQLELARNQTG